MDSEEVDVPRSIMDPAPPPSRRPKSGKRIIMVAASILAALVLIGVGYLVFSRMNNAGDNNDQAATNVVTPTPTPEPDITDDATIKQVAVEGRTFTHIVPATWDSTASDGDLQSAEFALTDSAGATIGQAVAAIRYNQGTYALNPAAPANSICDQIVEDSEVVKVSPNDERYINYCAKKSTSGQPVFMYVLFTKYSYKAGKTLSPAEQSDLLQNVLLYGRIQPQDDEPYMLPYDDTAQIQEFKDMIEIFRSIQYVEVDG